MAKSTRAPEPKPSETGPSAPAAPYTVVARRYRPPRFDDLVGQDHIVRALKNAIRLNRIAQAYLFCGTRGVGKTSIARIFAKCLNCVRGPTVDPCLECDACVAIGRGQDVDVIEIDGASNNGVEQVRELRQNAGLRPSRSHYKIYYIDEVHMLTTAAFNALLKTLEEPPAHVKFFFATTEPNKIPITVLSRCQRYDFAGIGPDAIAGSLAAVCAGEGVEAEPEALMVVARRAGGSLRDAQSLLESLLASGASPLTVELVQSLLGAASEESLLEILEAIVDHDPAAAVRLFAQTQGAGVQPGDLLNSLIDVTRDAMVVALGAESALLSVANRLLPRLKSIVQRSSVDTIIATLQILAEYRARMRGGAHAALLAEIALVKSARLERLSALGPLVERLSALPLDAMPAARTETISKRKIAAIDTPPERIETRPASLSTPIPEPTAPRPTTTPPQRRGPAASPEAAHQEITPPVKGSAPKPEDLPHETTPESEIELLKKRWPEITKKVGPRGWGLNQVEPTLIEGDVLFIAPKAGYNSDRSWWTGDVPAKTEAIVSKWVNRPVKIEYGQANGTTHAGGPAERAAAVAADPFIQKLVELFEARALNLEFDDPDTGH